MCCGHTLITKIYLAAASWMNVRRKTLDMVQSARRLIRGRGKEGRTQDSHSGKGEKGLEWKDVQEKSQ